MFALVADVKRYPEFLPWCPALRVVNEEVIGDRRMLIADMIVAYKVFREQFRSSVSLLEHKREILVTFVNGPFRRLHNHWRFEERGPSGSTVHFEIDFELSNALLQGAAHGFFQRKFERMSEAFVLRAHDIYNEKLVGTSNEL